MNTMNTMNTMDMIKQERPLVVVDIDGKNITLELGDAFISYGPDEDEDGAFELIGCSNDGAEVFDLYSLDYQVEINVGREWFESKDFFTMIED